MGFNPFNKKAKHPMLGLIRNPKAADKVNRAFAANHAADTVGMLSNKDMRKLIKQLQRVSSAFAAPARMLKAQGRHAEPILLEALNDPKFLASASASDHFLDDAPAVTAINLLGDCGSQQSIPALRRLLSHETFNDAALSVFIKLCDSEQFEEAVEHTQKSPKKRRERMILGIDNRFNENDADHELRVAASEWLKQHAFDENDRLDYRAAEVLVDIDPIAAKEFLLSPRCAEADDYSRNVAYRSLARKQIWIGADIASHRLSTEPDPESRANLLLCSVRGLSETAWQPIFDTLLRHVPKVEDRLKRDMLADTLLNTLSVWLGYNSYFELAGYTQEPDERTPIQQHLSSLIAFDADVTNGGLLQYFFNAEGKNWPVVQRVLTEIESTEVLTILDRSIKLLGLTTEDQTRTSIHAKLEALSSKQENTLNELDTQYYQAKSRLITKLCKHIAEHSQLLRNPAIQMNRSST